MHLYKTHLENLGITVGKQPRGMCEVTKERYIQLISGNIFYSYLNCYRIKSLTKMKRKKYILFKNSCLDCLLKT